MVYLKAFAVWLLLMFMETLHGTARLFLLAPLTGDFKARQIAVFTGAALIFTVTLLCIKWIAPTNAKQCLAIGSAWVLLTLGFEILLGILLFNMPWQRIAADYNLLQGGLMPIGLLLLLFTPLAAGKIRKIF